MQKILITGGAGFIGSNLCDYFISKGYHISCLDNFSTGYKHNINHLLNHPNFKLIEGDIRNLETCKNASKNVDYILHEAALGSIPRSINDPITTNDVNIGGFLNMLVAAKENHIKRFIFAASSSTYGDSRELPKMEDHIGKPLSPYAITKYVDELYADVFHKIYGLEYIGLRYFNVFGKRQDPQGAYAAVIPLFMKQLISHESPTINGDGEYSRDFTYIKNIQLMNDLAIHSTNKESINQIYNTAFGESTTLNQLVEYMKESLSNYDTQIPSIKCNYGPLRTGDIPHSLASITKAQTLLNYNPLFSVAQGLKEATEWYWNSLK